MPGLVTPSRTPAVNASGEAVPRAREKDPDPDHTPANSTATDSSRKKSMTEGIQVPVNSLSGQDTIGGTYSDGTESTAGSAGTSSSPARHIDPETTSKEAEDSSLKALPDDSPDRAGVAYSGGTLLPVACFRCRSYGCLPDNCIRQRTTLAGGHGFPGNGTGTALHDPGAFRVTGFPRPVRDRTGKFNP